MLDIDILDPEAADAIEQLVRDRFGDHGRVLPRFGKAPKRAIPFRTDKPFPKITAALIAGNGTDERIELLCDGQQAVVDGIHPDTKQPYRWTCGSIGEIRHDLPFISASEAQALVDHIAEILVAEHV